MYQCLIAENDSDCDVSDGRKTEVVDVISQDEADSERG